MKINWVAISGPGVRRLTTWTGKTKRVLVTGIDREFADNCNCQVELPPGAEVHDMPCDLPGYVFTVFESWEPQP